MHWIHQAPGKGLEWIIYYHSDRSKSNAQVVQGRFTASKDRTNFFLHISQLKPEDSALYYCPYKTHLVEKGRTLTLTGQMTPISSQKVGVYLQGPTLQELRTDGTVPVTCLLVGLSLGDFSVSWKVDGVVASQGGVTPTPKDHSNGTQTEQIMFNVSARDWHNSNYSCAVRHESSKRPITSTIENVFGEWTVDLNSAMD
uniref:Ig-like domain-containing protein n=1 Tax=Oncorhynchus mykiss TaxID=8022 RepID=A0A8K9WNS0_ONCMY